MKRPVDDVSLAMAERKGVEIDYCPVYRGVRLDGGELDEVIERSTPAKSHSRASPGVDHGGVLDGGYRRKKKKRSSLLDEMVDF